MDADLEVLYRLIDELSWPELTGDEDSEAFVDRLAWERAGKETR